MVDPKQELSALFTLFADHYDEKEFVADKRALTQEVDAISDEIDVLESEYWKAAEAWQTSMSEFNKALCLNRVSLLRKRIEAKESQLDRKQTWVALFTGFEAANTRLERADDPEGISTTDLAEAVQAKLVDDRFTVDQIHTILTVLGLPEQTLFVTDNSVTE